MEDPISREARRLEIAATEIEVMKLLHSLISKRVLSPVVQVQRSEEHLGYLVTANTTVARERYSAKVILADEMIDKHCTSVQHWKDFVDQIAVDLMGQLREVAPDSAFKRTGKLETNGSWYEALGQRPPGLRQLSDKHQADRQEYLSLRAAAEVERAKLEKVQEDMAIESIKRSFKRS